jgi:hypothetical protein
MRKSSSKNTKTKQRTGREVWRSAIIEASHAPIDTPEALG